MSFPFGISSSWALWWVGNIVNKTQNISLWLLKKRPNYESNSDLEETYSKFIALESKEFLLTKLSPFIIEKAISSIIYVR